MLGTQATVSREYTRALIREFSRKGCNVVLVGSPKLAALCRTGACRHAGRRTTTSRRKIAPCFGEGPRELDTDTVVLACTHYPLLLDRFGGCGLAGRLARPGAGDRAARRRTCSARPTGGIAQSGAEMIFTSQRPHTLSRALMPFFGGRVLA